MPSYKVMTHSLAEQSANLADVFSAVPVLPLAKAKIRKQAREGLPTHPGLSAVTVASLVDGFILYRYGWWAEDYALPQNKTLRHAFRESWSRRKARPQLSDEVSRTIRGRSATIPVTDYSNLAVADSGSFLTVTFDVTPVYADGSYPTGYVATMEQSSTQEALLGVEITSVDTLNSFGYPSTSKNIACEALVRFSDEVPMSSGETLQLFFDLQLIAVDRPHDEYGNDLTDVGVSVVGCNYSIQIPVAVP